MDLSNTPICPPDSCGGFSVILAERVLAYADALALPQQWHGLNLGHTTHRRTAYAPEHRLAALIAGLACGLRGIAPGNSLLRPNAALAARTGGRFPDQGTVHRWLDDTTPEQAAALRRHLHQAVTAHGRFWELLRAGPPLAIDLDGQGLVARGHRFEQAANGYLGDGLDRGYQRYVCYVGATAEVLDELLLPGNRTAMSALPEMLEGLNEVIPRAWRHRVLLRGDSHFGTAANVWAMKHAGYHSARDRGSRSAPAAACSAACRNSPTMTSKWQPRRQACADHRSAGSSGRAASGLIPPAQPLGVPRHHPGPFVHHRRLRQECELLAVGDVEDEQLLAAARRLIDRNRSRRVAEAEPVALADPARAALSGIIKPRLGGPVR